MRRWAPGALLVVAVALPAIALAKPARKPHKPAAAASASAATAASAPASASTSPSASTPSSTAAAAAGSAAGATGSVGGCVETLPSGAKRPTLTESFPSRGLSGYAATLRVVVDHGKGESVLPRGLELQSESDSAKALKSAGFVIPDQDGGAAARLTPNPADAQHPDRASTTLELPLLALPPEPGRHMLTLPPLPIAVARASGDIATVCTREHTLLVDDPTSSTPDAKPHPNPLARPQREEWTALRQVVTWGAVGIAMGAVLAYLYYRWSQRPRPVPPPPPPRPPWEVALEKLDEVRHAGLLEVGRFQDYFDRVNDAVRAYLGARYGFEGLESTTDEILHELRRASIERLAMPGVIDFFTECDLVKFAKFTPTSDACKDALDSAERIVRSTMPATFPSAFPPLGVAATPEIPKAEPPPTMGAAAGGPDATPKAEGPPKPPAEGQP